MNFVAIDVETANPSMGSICQIGAAVFCEGKIIKEWSSLIDPEELFAKANIAIHGIHPHTVQGQPKLPQIADELRSLLEENITVCHTHFDRVAIGRAFGKYRLSPVNARWVDSARVVRSAWPELAAKGYGLANICRKIGYEFIHHDALEDAKAAGVVLIAALKYSNEDLTYWCNGLNKSNSSVKQKYAEVVRRDGQSDGALYGEVLVFTGALVMSRNEAADLAAKVGCKVAPNVTKKTTILVVGDQDLRALAGYEKSSKHRKAEELAAEGSKIQIIGESEFRTLIDGV
jgi:DNA polymerase-3 subunit epsilon